MGKAVPVSGARKPRAPLAAMQNVGNHSENVLDTTLPKTRSRRANPHGGKTDDGIHVQST